MLDCEEALIEQARQGDQEAFRQLWEEHHGVTMAAAMRLCHERSLAEDITQGAFLLAWRGLPRFQAGLPFRPWLMRIMYRHALDVMERQRVYTRLSMPLAQEAQVSPSSQPRVTSSVERDPQELVAEREELRLALVQLKADQRKVIALRYGADLSEVEIAQVLGWPVGTVKSRLNRARERLRVYLLAERG
ncbi:MAG TPA: RNA polymerase sigma factor [Ktedonobacteraceae bacterium]